MALASTTWGNRRAGRLAVLLHGITGQSASWSGVGPALADDGFHVIAPDLPGHGVSAPTAATGLSDVVSALLETVGDRVDLLIGHSFGGTLALQALADEALRVHAVVLEDPVITLSAERAAAVIESEASWWPSTVDEARSRRPGWDDREVVVSMAARARLDVETARRMWTGNAPWDLTGSLISIRRCAAAAILVPEHSPYISASDADTFAAVTPEGAVVRLAGIGHRIHGDAPKRFLAAVREVVANASSPGGRG